MVDVASFGCGGSAVDSLPNTVESLPNVQHHENIFGVDSCGSSLGHWLGSRLVWS